MIDLETRKTTCKRCDKPVYVEVWPGTKTPPKYCSVCLSIQPCLIMQGSARVEIPRG